MKLNLVIYLHVVNKLTYCACLTLCLRIMEFIYETSSHLNDLQESTLLALSNDLNVLSANHPEIDLSPVSLHITQLLSSMDDLNMKCSQKNEELNSSRAVVESLENKLQHEIVLRREAMDTSFRFQDWAASDSLSAAERCKSLEAALRHRELQFSAALSDKDSLYSELNEMCARTKTLEDDIKKLNSVIRNLNFKTDLANKESKALSSMLNDKWVEDHTLDGYFQTMQDSVKSSSGCLFFGPATSEILKLGDEHDVSSVLCSPSYVSCKFVFICVSNSTTPGRGSSGSHWSLLFVDKLKNQAFHLDSLSGLNNEHALRIVRNLNIPVNNLFAIQCFQQNNGYECGLNVLVHAKLILHYFCCYSVNMSFLEWFYGDSGHKTVSIDLKADTPSCSILRTDPTPTLGSPKLSPVRLVKNTKKGWTIVKSKRLLGSNNHRYLPEKQHIACSNRFEPLVNEQPEAGFVNSGSGVWQTYNQKVVSHSTIINSSSKSRQKSNPKPKSKSRVTERSVSDGSVFDVSVNSSLAEQLSHNEFVSQNVSENANGKLIPEYDCPSAKKPKIRLFSDSHGRGMGHLLNNRWSDKFDVQVSVKPGAKLSDVALEAEKCSAVMVKTDFLVVMAGTNDVDSGHCNASILKIILDLAKGTSSTNLIIVGVPFRKDKPHLNKLISQINSKILNAVSTFGHVQFQSLSSVFKSCFYDRRGLHFSLSGKASICGLLTRTLQALVFGESTPDTSFSASNPSLIPVRVSSRSQVLYSHNSTYRDGSSDNLFNRTAAIPSGSFVNNCSVCPSNEKSNTTPRNNFLDNPISQIKNP